MRDWATAANGKITTWEYSLSVVNWVHAPVQFPNVARNHYANNRDILHGSFLNGGSIREWTTSAPTMYIWVRSMWNPEIDVDKTLQEMCRRMFGNAAEPAHELLSLMIDRYENAPWPGFIGNAEKMLAPVTLL